MPAGLIIAGASAQTGIGAYNMWKGQQEYSRLMRNAPQYSYETPQAIKNAEDVAAAGYYAGSPYGQYEQSALSAASGATRQVEKYGSSSQDILGGIQNIYSSELDQLNKIALNDLNARDMARNSYIQTLTTEGSMEAQGKQQEFEYNKWLPWQMQLNAAAEKAGMGRNMMYQGIGQGFGAVAEYANTQSLLRKLAEMFPTDTTGTDTTGASSSPGIQYNYQDFPKLQTYNYNYPIIGADYSTWHK